MSMLPPSQSDALRRLERRALVVGVVALAACAIGAPFSPAQFFRAYLTAYQFYLGIGLGCFAILMMYYLTGGAWGYLERRLLEAGMRTLPLLALLFIPVACGVQYLYIWARPEVVAERPDLQYKHPYLNVPFYWIRAALFFGAWIAVAYFLSAWSRRQDQTADRALPRKFRQLSAAGLVVYGVAITFGSVDWVMSLQPSFRSTIWGPLFAAGQILCGQAFVVIVLGALIKSAPFRQVVSPDVLNDIGNLLFTFLVIWAYLTLFQFLLIWMANLPAEVTWYLPRVSGGWRWVAWAIFILHFAVPFFLLLLRDVKRRPETLVWVAGVILFMHLVTLYWEIMPAFPDTSLGEHWMDFLTPVGLGGIWLAFFLWQLRRYPVLPQADPERAEAVHLRTSELEEAARREAISHG